MKKVDVTTHKFFEKYRSRTIKKGSVLLFPGETVTNVFYIEKGVVEQFAITESGSRICVSTFKPGAFIPMMSVVTSSPSRHYFEAIAPVNVVRSAPANEVLKFIRSEPDVMYNLLERMYTGLDGVLSRMTQHMSGNAESRIKTELLILAKRYGKIQSDGYIELQPVSDQILSTRTGMARETISRSMAFFKADGTVQRTHNGLKVNPKKIGY